MTLAPETSANVKPNLNPNLNPNPNPKPNPYINLHQKPDDSPRSYSLSPVM